MPNLNEKRGLSPITAAQKAWLTISIAVSLVGGVSVVTFAVWWMIHVRGDCGVVRFYEQVFAVILVGGWFVGTAVGLGLAVHGFKRKSRSTVPGAVIAILVNLVVLLLCANVVHTVRKADFSLKSNELLMRFLQGEDMDKRKLAAHELGERRATEAVPLLCAILEESEGDINLRLNASIALGKICAPPPSSNATIDQAVPSLIEALKDEDRFLPKLAAEALGKIGDVRAVGPLSDLLSDRTKNPYTRESAAIALGNIGSDKALEALKQALVACRDEELAKRIGDLIYNLKHP